MATFIYSNGYTMDWAEHVFPVHKFRMVYERLIKEGVVRKDAFLEPKPATYNELTLIHTPEYISMLNDMAERKDTYAEIPITEEVINSFKLSVGGSILAGREAVKNGAAANLSGGFHHAFSEHGEGFCLINDIALTIRVLQNDGHIQRAAVIDCDLHQGNGTAKIFANDKDVFTFSIHQEHNYPIKEKSNWDIGLDDFSGNEEYISALRDAIPKVLDIHKPDFVAYVAGADPYEEDQLGLLKLTKAGLLERDGIVLTNTIERKIPILVLPAGGYARRMEDVVDIHFNTFKLLKELNS